MGELEISKQQLVEYLRSAQQIEAGKYYMQSMYNVYDRQIRNLESKVNQIKNRRYVIPERPGEKPTKHKPKKERSIGLIIVVAIVIFLFINMKNSFFGALAGPVFALPFLIGGPIVIGIFIDQAKDNHEKSREAEVDYQNRLSKYNHDVETYPKRVADYNRALENARIEMENINRTISQLNAQKNEISAKIYQVNEHRKKIYSSGMIHSTYQTLEATTRFVEYFESGMCDTLKEAMQTYNMESIMNKIATRIDDLTDAMRDIQYELYDLKTTVSDSARLLSYNLENATRSINNNLEIQNTYAEIKAKCDKEILQNVEMIKYYEEYRWLNDR